jgi:hypothetical protein
VLRTNPTGRYLANAIAKAGKPIMRELTLAEAVRMVNDA